MELDRASEFYSVWVFVVAWKLWFVTRLHVFYMTSFNVIELARLLLLHFCLLRKDVLLVGPNNPGHVLFCVAFFF